MYLITVHREFCARRYPRGRGESEDGEAQADRLTVGLVVGCDRVPRGGGKALEFSLLEKLLKRVLNDLDGEHLADLEMFQQAPPSLEVLARFLFKKTEILLEHHGVRSVELTVEDSGGHLVAYRP